MRRVAAVAQERAEQRRRGEERAEGRADASNRRPQRVSEASEDGAARTSAGLNSLTCCCSGPAVRSAHKCRSDSHSHRPALSHMDQHNNESDSTASSSPEQIAHFVHPALAAHASSADPLWLRRLSLLLLRADDLADDVAHPDIDSDFAISALADWRDEARELISSAATSSDSSSAPLAGSAALQHFDRLIQLHQQHQRAALTAAACPRKTFDEAAAATKQH